MKTVVARARVAANRVSAKRSHVAKEDVFGALVNICIFSKGL